jgi:hypothetical protein
MKHRIKNIITGIKNLWKWRKIIFKDRDCDHWYIYEIMKVKLRFNAEYAEKHGYHQKSAHDVHLMRYVADLIDKVQNESYINEALDKYDINDNRLDEAITKHNESRREIFNLMQENIEWWWE